MPLVSLYMPTHNRAHMVSRAIESVLAQTHPDIELLVVDDGSSDNTKQVLERYEQSPKVRVLHNAQAAGACAARNRAIAVAAGEFITGIDDDDEIAPNHVANLLSHYNDNYACVAASMKEDTGSQVIVRSLHTGEVTLDSLLHYNKVGNQVLTRTERVRALGGFDEALPAFQDYDLWVRLVARYGPCLKLPDATYTLHTAHEQRITRSSEKTLSALDMFIQKHSNLMGQGHRHSMEITRRRLANEPFSLRDLVRLANRNNLTAALALYANTNLAPLKRLADSIRR